MADDDLARAIVFTEEAVKYLRLSRITNGEFKRISAKLKQVARLPCPEEDFSVCPISQCGRGKWLRLKLTQPQIRVAFTYNETTLTVYAILRRTDRTYDLLSLEYKRVLKGD